MFIEIGFTGELRSIGAPYGLCRNISHLTARGFQNTGPGYKHLAPTERSSRAGVRLRVQGFGP